MTTFELDQVTDAKRVVRGEHYKYASKLLNSRTFNWQPEFTCLILPGRSAKEEICCLRTAIPRSKIIAVDRDPVAVEIALAAGVDDAIHGDLFEGPKMRGRGINECSMKLKVNYGRFDLINLDFCGNITESLVQGIRYFLSEMIKTHGVMILSFSYGRDAADAFVRLARNGEFDGNRNNDWEISDSMLGRIKAIVPCSYRKLHYEIKSVLLYKGKHMPMCSLLIEKGKPQWNKVLVDYNGNRKYDYECEQDCLTIMKVIDGDIRPACLFETELNSSDLYCVPASRVAAWRAVETRMMRESKENSPCLFE